MARKTNLATAGESALRNLNWIVDTFSQERDPAIFSRNAHDIARWVKAAIAADMPIPQAIVNHRFSWGR